MAEVPKPPQYKQLGEPVKRPDGRVVTLRTSEDGHLDITVGAIGSVYTPEEVLLLGNGNARIGIMRIGRAHYQVPNPSPIGNKLFLDEIRKSE